MDSVFREGLLDGQVALVTGGGTGIGFGIAMALAKLGCDIVLVSRRSVHLDPAARQLIELGVRALPVTADVRDPDSVRDAVARGTDTFGRLDVLVNNAAGNFYSPSADLSPKGWKAVVETDLYGTFYTSQAAYPTMREQGGGSIVSISMTLHYRGWPMMAHATAAKAGVDALTRTLALEWAPDGIRVNAVAPGPVPTPGATKAFAAAGEDAAALSEEMRRFIPLKRWGEPEEIGQMVAYLASPAGTWITGQIFVVDGGSSLART
jgi:peroxisomal 2,4-dienoyl-CoA reductase